MFAPKFPVRIDRKTSINILGYTLRVERFGSGKLANRTGCDKAENVTVEEAVNTRCNEYQEKLSRCPRTQTRERSWFKKIFSSEPEPKCAPKPIGDEYHKAVRTVKVRANEITNEVGNEARTILEELERSLDNSRRSTSTRFDEISSGVQAKLVELIGLDPTLGSAKRRCVLSLNDETSRAFEELHRNVRPCVQQIDQSLERLRCDLSCCVERAVDLVLGCRKCSGPRQLENCLGRNAEFAVKCLNKASKDARDRLTEIKEYRDEMLRNHETETKEAVAAYAEKGAELSRHLDRCILAIKCLNES